MTFRHVTICHYNIGYLESKGMRTYFCSFHKKNYGIRKYLFLYLKKKEGDGC